MANQLKEELILNSSQFDKNINNVIKKVEELKNKGSKVGGGFESSLGKMIQKATGFNGSMGSLIGVVGKFSGALGATTTALKVAKDAFMASEANYDEWQRVIKSSESVYNGFLNSINNGDISGFLSNIDQIVSAAREAYDALDTLGTMRTIQAPQISKQETENQRMLMMLRTGRYIAPQDGRAPTPGLKDGDKLTKEQLEILKRQLGGGINKLIGYNKNEITQTRKAVDAYYNKLAKENGMSFNEFREGTSSWAAFSKKLKGYQKYREWEAEAQTRFAKQGGRGHTNFDNSNPYYKFKKWGNFRVDKMGEGSYNDLVNLIKAGNQQEAQLYSTIGQVYRTFNRVDKQTSGGGGRGGRGGGSTEIEYAINSVGWLEQQIQLLKKEIKLQVDSSEIENLNEQIKTLQLQLDALQRPYKPINNALNGSKGVSPYTMPTIDQIKETKPSQQFNTLEDYFEQYSNRASEVLRKLDIGIIGNDLAKELIDSINAQLQAIGLKPLEINIKTDAQEKLEGIASQVDQLGSAFRGLGQGFELPALDIMGVIGQSIANVLLSYSQAMLKPKDPISWLTFGLMGLGEVAAIISQIHSLSGYANGGVIGGSSFAGDNLLVRANSGEMILNTFQQKHLFNLLDKGATGNVSSGNVNFVIRGKDLHGVLSNYDDKMKKVR